MYEVFAGAVVLLCYMMVVFLVALVRKNNSIADVAYGLGFVLLAGFVWFSVGGGVVSLTVTLLIALWGIRLAGRIHRRNRGKPEDFRYAQWRATWKWFKTRSFFQVFLLQGLIIYVIALPSLVTIASAPPVTFLTVCGIVLWVLGFYFETVGDHQLDTFLRNPENKGKIIQSGLWHYTRHPNYFGEALMWWGLWVVALPVVYTSGFVYVGASFLLSPFLITYLLRYVSGVPMVEKALAQKAEWAAYAAETPVFLPWKLLYPRTK